MVSNHGPGMFHNIPRHCWNDVLAGFGCGIPSKFRVLAGKMDHASVMLPLFLVALVAR